MNCLYECGSDSPSTDVYDVLPFSATAIRLCLPKGVVCDKCNHYFGNKLENHFCHNHPGVIHKVFRVNSTSNHRAPKVSLDDGEVLRTKTTEGTFNVHIPIKEIALDHISGQSMAISSSVNTTPFKSRIISRTLAKIAFECQYIARIESPILSTINYDAYKKYIRNNTGKYIPFAYESLPNQKQMLPSFTIREADGIVTSGCAHISFPGILYHIPLPPINAEGRFVFDESSNGVVCAEEREYSNSVPIVMKWHSRKSSE